MSRRGSSLDERGALATPFQGGHLWATPRCRVYRKRSICCCQVLIHLKGRDHSSIKGHRHPDVNTAKGTDMTQGGVISVATGGRGSLRRKGRGGRERREATYRRGEVLMTWGEFHEKKGKRECSMRGKRVVEGTCTACSVQQQGSSR